MFTIRAVEKTYQISDLHFKKQEMNILYSFLEEKYQYYMSLGISEQQIYAIGIDKVLQNISEFFEIIFNI